MTPPFAVETVAPSVSVAIPRALRGLHGPELGPPARASQRPKGLPRAGRLISRGVVRLTDCTVSYFLEPRKCSAAIAG